MVVLGLGDRERMSDVVRTEDGVLVQSGSSADVGFFVSDDFEISLGEPLFDGSIQMNGMHSLEIEGQTPFDQAVRDLEDRAN